jgi:alkylation response protein AidB-like acyl-CoA dehydrogenase
VHPGPFLSTNVVASALARCGTQAVREQYLPDVVTGRRVGAWAHTGTVAASKTPTGYVLSGVSECVVDAPVADILLVNASLSGHAAQFVVPADVTGVRVEPLETLDVARRIAAVHFAETNVSAAAALCIDHDCSACAERQLQLALVTQCAETIGVADRGLHMTIDYAKDRVAFGRPIGSYQALKHRMATHRIRLEGAVAATAYAARAVQYARPDAALAVRAAKAFVGRWSTAILHDCVQLSGGLGMTWDYDLHLYFRRAISNEQLLGSPDEHCRALVDLVEGSAA